MNKSPISLPPIPSLLVVFVMTLAAQAEPHRLWSGGEVPAKADLRFPEGVEIHDITPRTPEKSEGRIWRKGADVIWHKGVLHASFGWNNRFDTQGENSPGESCAWLTSEDGGKTWSELDFIARGDEVGGISHGVFLSHKGRLWSFNGAFTGKIGKVRTLAFLLDEESGTWEPKGEVVGGGFWALQKPMKLPDGNWILSGARIGDGHPAAVAISHGDDFTKWDLVVIPQGEGVTKMWGESALIRDGDRLVNIARYHREGDFVALVSTSDDGGRTWTPSTPSNLPMVDSKPYAGRLSNGQPYLVNTISADVTKLRNPLSIAVGEPGAGSFSRVFQIDDVGAMMYPGAWEHHGHLYIAYTRHFAPRLAVVPVASLAVDTPGLASKPLPEPAGPAHWTFDSEKTPGLTLRGQNAETTTVEGVEGKALSLDGRSVFVVEDSAPYAPGNPGFTLTLWANPYAPRSGEQQILAGKNRYSRNQREWGVMIDRDGLFRLYVWQNGWKTIAAEAKPKPGHWQQVGVVVQPDEAQLWVNGEKAGAVALTEPIARTGAPLTFGGIDDAGNIRQTFFGAIDEVRYLDRPLGAEEMTAGYQPHDATLPIPERSAFGPQPSPYWDAVGKRNAKEDRTTLIFDGKSPDQLACDTTLRKMPDGSWVMIMLGGGDTEPLPQNRVFLTRSHDEGKTWSPLEPIDLGIKSKNPDTALVPSELMIHGGRATMFVATHDGTFADWKEWMTYSDDSGRTWSALEPAPGRLHDRTFIRNHIVTRDGCILLPYQHYLRVAETREISKGRLFSAPTNPRNGVLMSDDGGKTWTERGNIRISEDDDYHGWAENNIVELADGRIAMIIRADRLGGVLYYAESTDGGRTWPEFAKPTDLPNPGSKAVLHGLGGDRVALLHNPNPRGRHPLSLWISFDGMKTWPYQRVLVSESGRGPGRALNYPDGFVSEDGKYLHFAFDDARYRAVYVGARLPEMPEIWDDTTELPAAVDLPELDDVEFHVIKKWDKPADGYTFLHGVGLAWHKGKLYASFGHNQGAENTVTEEAQYRVSEDGGKTWGPLQVIDAGEEENLAVSHGVFLSHEGTLWAFHGAYYGKMENIHTRAYSLDEATGKWTKHGVVVENGFWALNQPVRMDDGNWIMSGGSFGLYSNEAVFPAAVAISHGDDFTKWDFVRIEPDKAIDRMWGESSLFVDGPKVYNIARYGGGASALVAKSEDYGRTWTPTEISNLPMATSKPAAGVLSTGQRYLVCTTARNNGGKRTPLTIAVSRPGKNRFSRVFVIRRSQNPDHPGESADHLNLSYPCVMNMRFGTPSQKAPSTGVIREPPR
jgi:predicted neuraminidase